MSPSPKPSVEATQSPTSPFLHNLSQRLRKGSTTSRRSSQSSENTHSNPEGPPPAQDTRSTKRYLLSILRDDWEYPSPNPQSYNLRLQRDAVSYSHRHDSMSDNDSHSDKRPTSTEENAYRFDSPDDVGTVVERRRARKRRLIEQEMTWNQGLRTWTLQRDAWVGAVSHKPEVSTGIPKYTKQSSLISNTRNSSESTALSTGSVPSWPLPNDQGQTFPPTSPANTSWDLDRIDTRQDSYDGPYLPIYPPLLPASHSLRSRIKPSSYPTIYSKVVVQSLAPNVPVPLNHMIGALVEGWKAEGNWPPAPSAPTRSGLAGRKGKNGESAFQKWKREQDQKRKAARQISQAIEWQQDDGQHKGHGVRKSLVGGVKKAFGMGATDQDGIDKDLEKIGLTFEPDEELEAQAAEVLKNGHI